MLNKPSRVSYLLKDSFIYSVSIVLSKASYLLLTPIYTSVFKPAEYGLISLINSTIFFLGNFLVFSMDYATGRWYFDSEDSHHRKSVFSNWFFFQLSLSALVFGSYFLVPNRILTDFFGNSNIRILLLIPLCGLIISTPITILQNYYRFKQEPLNSGMFSVTYGTATAIFTIGGLYLIRADLWVVFIAQFGVTAVFSVWAYLRLSPVIKFKYVDTNKLNRMISFAIPLVPSGLSFWILNSGALFFINYSFGKADAGIYGVAITLSAVVSIVTSAFASAWGPFAMNLVNSNAEAPKIISKMFTVYVVGCSFVWFSFVVLLEELLKFLVSPDYFRAGPLIAVLSLNFFVYSYSYFTKLGNDLRKDSKPLSVAIVASAIISICGYKLLVPLYGNIGAAISSLLGQSFIPIIVYFPAQKTFRIPYEFGISITYFVSITMLGLLITTNVVRIGGNFAGPLMLILIIGGITINILRKHLRYLSSINLARSK